MQKYNLNTARSHQLHQMCSQYQLRSSKNDSSSSPYTSFIMKLAILELHSGMGTMLNLTLKKSDSLKQDYSLI